ncbi:hypothetical protein PTKIN_Ptkin05aG0034600 [Pterospermum kingtungense]
MASNKGSAPIALLLSLNLLFFTLVSSQPPPPPTGCPLVRLGACANLMRLFALNISLPPDSSGSPCCNTIAGLGSTGAEVGACLCTNVRLNVLNMIAASLRVGLTNALLNTCQSPGNVTTCS